MRLIFTGICDKNGVKVSLPSIGRYVSVRVVHLWRYSAWFLWYLVLMIMRFVIPVVFYEITNVESYVYWTVHHLDSWIRGDQLDVTCFIIALFNAQHVSDVNTSILRSLLLTCWVISWVVLLWFDVCWCYVVVWLGWCGVRIQAEALVLQLAYGYHTTPAKLQRNTNTSVCKLKH